MANRNDSPAEYEDADMVLEAQLARDLELARVTDMPVLISGTPAASRKVARELDRRGRRTVGGVEVVDCRREGALGTVQSLTRQRPTDLEDQRRWTVLLEEVHALAPGDQALLEREIEQVRTSPHPPVRFVASSSAPLFDRVVDQLFSERLYYRLNVIHVVLPARAGE